MVDAQPIVPVHATVAVAHGGGGQTLEIFAPQGKLGVIIDQAHDGLPIVSVVMEKSPVAGTLQVGDKILEIDDENVACMTSDQISELLSSKSENAKRKLTILRTGTEV
mmetsp:Transcript_4297/g.9659  ORF Transcript_4297/g.9659 Transcript_4297/m.9659 type:complete len:108 (-) Transcript_4297:2119-2442(-)